MTPVKILAEHGGVVAILKPAGLATQAAPGVPSVEAWARQALAGRGGSGYLGVPHRLDRAVSGVLLLAATPRAARKLARQFERREVKKTYLAVVSHPAEAAVLPEQWTEWRDRVAKIPDEPRGRVVAAAEEGREAVTQVRVAGLGDVAGERRMVLELLPTTGRMHQLRLQAAARGMPVVGDLLYGGPPLPDPVGTAGDPRTMPILLHAWKICYADPDSTEPIEVVAPLPDFWPQWTGPAAE